MHLLGWDLVSLLLCLCKRWAKRTNPGCFWHPLLIMNYLVSFKRREKGGALLEELRKSPSSHFLCSVISDEKPWLRKAIFKESVSPWQCPEGYIHGPLSEDIVVFGQAWLWCQTGIRYTHYIWQSLKGTKFARFIIFMVKWQRLRKLSKWSIIQHIRFQRIPTYFRW